MPGRRVRRVRSRRKPAADRLPTNSDYEDIKDSFVAQDEPDVFKQYSLGRDGYKDVPWLNFKDVLKLVLKAYDAEDTGSLMFCLFCAPLVTDFSVYLQSTRDRTLLPPKSSVSSLLKTPLSPSSTQLIRLLPLRRHLLLRTRARRRPNSPTRAPSTP